MPNQDFTRKTASAAELMRKKAAEKAARDEASHVVERWADHAKGREADRQHACHRAANGEQEIDRELAPPADALRVALMMLARRGPLEIGDVLKALAQN